MDLIALLSIVAVDAETVASFQTSTLVLAGITFAIGCAVGGVVVSMMKAASERSMTRNSLPRYPKDWPSTKEMFTRDPNALYGYLEATGKQVIKSKAHSGAVRIGRLYPGTEWFRYVPEVWPLTRLREWVLRATTKEIWIPLAKRLQHFAIIGPTGMGKSTRWALPALVYGALEEGTAYLAIDVKSPQFVRMFARLYKAAGKDVLFFDPWSIEETLAYEPLWRASSEQLNTLAAVINGYSISPGETQQSGNSEFFSEAARRVLRGTLELATFWPRRYCNLPCVQQLVVAGFEKVEEAFRQAPGLQPAFADIRAAADVVIAAPSSELRKLPRSGSQDLTRALEVLDRSGYKTAYYVRQMRRYAAARKSGSMPEHEYAKVYEEFVQELEVEAERRRHQLQKLLESQGEFLDMPAETKGSVMSGLTNKVSWFSDANVARAFSQDELDIKAIVERPCLLLVGAPMARLEVGSLFVASIVTNLAIKAVFQRGAAIEAGSDKVWKGKTFFLLDEFPQLNIKKASQVLATFRGFLGGLMIIYQDRSQLKTVYRDDAPNVEGNCVHGVLLGGAHIETCELYEKGFAEVPVVTRSISGGQGDKKSISESVQEKRLMNKADIHDMRINGEKKDGAALSIGSSAPYFPIIPVAFWDDPIIRKLLNMKRKVIKNGPFFWNWMDRWDVPIDNTQRYVHRRKRTREPNDPVSARIADPFGQYLDYLIGKPKERVVRGDEKGVERTVTELIYDELVVPDLVLDHVLGLAPVSGVSASPPSPMTSQSGGASAGPVKPRPAGTPVKRAPEVVPVYGSDFRVLVNEDFREPQPLRESMPPGGTVIDRFQDEGDNS
jgi:hypothetical protein